MNSPADLTWVELIVQLATAGGFGALVWYLVVKHIPHIEERHQNERSEWLDYIKRRDDDFDQMYQKNLEQNMEIQNRLEKLQIRIENVSPSQ
ncbi:MAG: hypothetical protein NWE83_07415 [Candidatus Bathyarchaeota archaeon]|nr:hypothetical protein [Candidatus Bathyarchaeota archaeon]